MQNQPLEIKAALQIQRPPHTVFEAIVDPAQMSNYFISTSTGRMEEGARLTWMFPEFTMQVPVRVGTIRPDEYISYYWPAEDGRELLVEITLTPAANHSTVVAITEGRMELNDVGLAWLKGNTEGWANFLACLKAWVEYGINLRKGAWDFRSDITAEA
jgi:uncharacterized protein YndB with AHSA1/START domain